ncbi:hypothetical protein GCM10023169_17080 [Georgenia halophila]|uniref:DUF4345 domain-containing protein n=1 Tax=Georgenia halophila TaxID=620889 RepID=A0ABP8L5B7_9MICO
MGSETKGAILRGLMWSMAGTAALTGTLVMTRGHRGIPGSTTAPDASTDSVLRFYSVIWATQAAVFGRAAARRTLDRGELDRLAVITAAGGAARALAWRSSGRPHPLFRVLTVQELAMPVVVRLLR